MAHLFTKTGDTGQTSLFNGKRVSKNDLRVATYGEIDEVICMISYAASLLPNECLVAKNNKLNFTKEVEFLHSIEKVLFNIGFELANPDFNIEKAAFEYLKKENIEIIESKIIEYENMLPTLKSFILPTGTIAASYVQVCRAKVRTIERTITFFAIDNKIRPEIQIYINRLSDYLFMLARFINYKLQVKEILV